MATLLLASAGTGIGGAVGGTLLGFTAAGIGQAAGAVAGGMIDQRLLGAGSAVPRGRARSLRIQGAAEGAPLPRLWGRMRVAGTLIWSTRYRERIREGDQGAKSGTPVRAYAYSISFAVALCEGPIARVGRIWADGKPLCREEVQVRVHTGTDGQLPDPKIEAVEGSAPAYRGTAYLVFEDLELERFGNRIPQINAEVFRQAEDRPAGPEHAPPLSELVEGVALSPGTGEFALEPRVARYVFEGGGTQAANVNSSGCKPDMLVALDQLKGELPACGHVALVVSWFGDDLRAGHCRVEPRCEEPDRDALPEPWSVAGLTTSTARLVGRDSGGRPVYGGTPSDASVIGAIREMKARGLKVLLYPFLLMDVPPDNTLPDPWTGGTGQPPYPWRGRITTELAPGLPGTTDQTAAAAGEVDAFFGTATAGDFTVSEDTVAYAGPEEWTWSRFALHLAALGAASGGVDSIVIGTELRALTQIRSARTTYPMVDRLIGLAAEVRALLPEALISYAADWSEYFGHQPGDGTGDRIFHLDPLWADPNIDFVAIDDYLPLSDWRHEGPNADRDAGHPSGWSLPYLKSNVEGGEHYDFYYASDADRRAQIRTPIEDAAGADRIAAPDRPADHAFGPGAHTTIPESERLQPVVIRVPVTFPATLSDAVLVDLGGAYNGASFVLRDGGATLRWRAGDGRSPLPNSHSAWVDVPAGPYAGTTATFLLACDPAAGTAALYADGVLLGTDTADAGELLPIGGAGPGWAGSDDIGIGWTDNITKGEPEASFTGSFAAPVEFWIDAAPTLIPGGAGEHWIFRPKDIRNWWANPHHDRIGGVRQATPTAWTPQSKPVWLTETGCPAVDLGANQPNLFFDPKSSESAFPWFSNGARDDTIQRRYLQAKLEYWQDPANNPQAAGYDGRMIPPGRIYAWTWDLRPFPAFPMRESVWSDGPNYELGHWLTGRVSSGDLADVVHEICKRAGVDAIDVARLYGTVHGFLQEDPDTARAVLQPLMLAYGFDAFEAEGALAFLLRGVARAEALDPARLVASDDALGPLVRSRASAAELPEAVRLAYLDAESDFRAAAAETRLPEGDLARALESSVPLAFPRSRAQAITDRWLAETRRARDRASFALAPEAARLVPSDVVALPGPGGTETYRIERLTQGMAREAEAVRVDPTIYRPAAADASSGRPEAPQPEMPGPLTAVLLDLPLADGSGDHHPRIAVTADPWPGAVTVHRAPQDSGYAEVAAITRPAAIGNLAAPLPPADAALWQRVEVELALPQGALAAADRLSVLNGANALAVEAAPGAWEILQARDAMLTAPGRLRIGHLLRGRRGTEHLAAAEIPAGARVVVLDDAVTELPLPADLRGLPRHYRVVPAGRDFFHAEAVHLEASTPGAGLRPFAPAHPAARRLGDGGISLTWIRRTRIGGDSWEGIEVPLGEAREAYRVRVLSGATELRRAETSRPDWTYTPAAQADDGAAGSLSLRVAQLSDAWGAGPETEVTIHV